MVSASQTSLLHSSFQPWQNFAVEGVGCYHYSKIQDSRLINMNSSNETELRETIRSVFRGKPVERVELFGSAARGGMTPRSDLDILVTPSPAATRRDLFVMAAELEDAVGRQVDFLIRADVEAMKNIEARDLILGTAVTLYVS
jgi:predicted nucleotidyltransferase